MSRWEKEVSRWTHVKNQQEEILVQDSCHHHRLQYKQKFPAKRSTAGKVNTKCRNRPKLSFYLIFVIVSLMYIMHIYAQCISFEDVWDGAMQFIKTWFSQNLKNVPNMTFECFLSITVSSSNSKPGYLPLHGPQRMQENKVGFNALSSVSCLGWSCACCRCSIS